MTLLECCVNNVRERKYETLEESSHRVRLSSCLDRCGDCHERAVLVVDGDIHTGESYQELLVGVNGRSPVTDE